MFLLKWLKSALLTRKSSPLMVLDRASGKLIEEKIFGKSALFFLYGKNGGIAQRLLGPPLRFLSARCAFVSSLYGWWQRRVASRRAIAPFIAAFDLDSSEWADKVCSYASFDAFFTRRLKATARPLDPDTNSAVMPCDGRFLGYEKVDRNATVTIKGQQLDIGTLIGDRELAGRYCGGSLLLARLCPSDYHRFHFPISGYVEAPRFIKGWRYSVSPLALAYNLSILCQNKRAVVAIHNTDCQDPLLYVAIGATNVGSIHFTYTPDSFQLRGSELGYFSFGASALALLFPPGAISLAPDLLEATKNGYEMRCLMGQRLGTLLFK